MHPLRALFHDLPRQGPGSAVYTRRAFEATGLQRHASPRLLDVGCGSGASTLALAAEYPCNVLAVDIDADFLATLDRAAGAAVLRGTIETRCASMFDLDFPADTFDAVWSEGALYILGFAEGLHRWRDVVRPGGYVVVSELSWLTESPPEPAAEFWHEAYPAMTTVPRNRATAEALGYVVRESFQLGPDAFLPEYYEPLQVGVHALRAALPADDPAQEMLRSLEAEIALYRAHSETYSYVFYICQVTT